MLVDSESFLNRHSSSGIKAANATASSVPGNQNAGARDMDSWRTLNLNATAKIQSFASARTARYEGSFTSSEWAIE